MGYTAAFDWVAIAKAAQPQLHKVAESIADTAAPRFIYTRHRNRSHFKITDHADGTVNVAQTDGDAHLDEYGTGTGGRPAGAMRSAAIEHGHYTPNPK